MSILTKVVIDGAIAQNDGLIKKTQNLNDQNQHLQEVIRANKLGSNSYIEDLEDDNDKLKAENKVYKDLLTKPMNEIANLNDSFKKTYHEQQTILGEWIVSQRAFKELAIKLGLETGRSKEDVIQEGLANDEKVLNCETEHGNDFNQSEWQRYYAPKIKAKLEIK